METEQEFKSVSSLITLFKKQVLVANPEYQRGTVWSKTLKKKLIDSLLRGYPLPLIYLHYKKEQVDEISIERLEIIDGQQRITALFEFSENNFILFDPLKDDNEAKFPLFLKQQPCPWAGQRFAFMNEEIQKKFLETKLPVVRIKTNDENEVRDLFVRLQSGLPLNAQATRDAWPGQFTEFVLAVGGKPELARYPGHTFFSRMMGLNPKTDRGKTRQFTAQLLMLFFWHQKNGSSNFPDIKSSAINDFYFSNIDFNRDRLEAKRFIDILDKLVQLLGNGNRPKLKAHDAIHLVLFVDSIWDDYARTWEDHLEPALDKFLEQLAIGNSQRDADKQSEFWVRYGQWTRVNSDQGERISHRHAFYVQKMHDFLGESLKLRDSQRIFGRLEREIIYYKSKKKCAVCDSQVAWEDAEIHHVIGFATGGPTIEDNAALVHSLCHPKSASETQKFALKFFADRKNNKQMKLSHDEDSIGYNWLYTGGRLFLPEGTKLRMSYKNIDYEAHVRNAEIIYLGKSVSPAKLANEITGTSRNAWRDLWVCFPHNDEWVLSDDLRKTSQENLVDVLDE